MKRDLDRLSDSVYDVLIIGGGIYGASIAWDAALRGLSVALLERGDFGHATSSNSCKIVHGGLRYLQYADFKLMRTMIHERMVLMGIAPHLVHPIPFLMPTYRKTIKCKTVMAGALLLNDLVGFDRNRLHDPQKLIRRGRVISKGACVQILPGVPQAGLTGGALWYDGQIYNSERLTLSFVISADQAGAQVTNYVEVTGFIKKDATITGVKAKDACTGNDLEVRAHVVVNAAGPWADTVLKSINDDFSRGKTDFSIALSLITRQILPDVAVGVPRRHPAKSANTKLDGRSGLLFISPWRGYSLIGSDHIPFEGEPNDCRPLVENRIGVLLEEANSAYPEAKLKREDVRFVHCGFLPSIPHRDASRKVRLLRHNRIRDHQIEDGINGLLTVVGVKLTSARAAAERVVDHAFRMLGRKAPQCETRTAPLYGGKITDFDGFLEQETSAQSKKLRADTIQHLVYNYGSEYCRILEYLNKDQDFGQKICSSSDAIKAEIVHSVREEMAQKLSDVILRRTELGSAGDPGEECLKNSADIMASELGWDEARVQDELQEVKRIFQGIVP